MLLCGTDQKFPQSTPLKGSCRSVHLGRACSCTERDLTSPEAGLSPGKQGSPIARFTVPGYAWQRRSSDDQGRDLLGASCCSWLRWATCCPGFRRSTSATSYRFCASARPSFDLWTPLQVTAANGYGRGARAQRSGAGDFGSASPVRPRSPSGAPPCGRRGLDGSDEGQARRFVDYTR